jgi:thiamine-phosphate pyrophosphorylase
MITDRRAAGGTDALISLIQRRMTEGIEALQIREKDLEARELFELVRAVMALPNPHGARVIVNGRLDVALAAGAHGVHLPAGSPAPSSFRAVTPKGFAIGVSCHTLEEVRVSRDADYLMLAPVFAPLSKPREAPPLGVEGLREAARISKVPVVALGGITEGRIQQCLEAGASGVAGISLFL